MHKLLDCRPKWLTLSKSFWKSNPILCLLSTHPGPLILRVIVANDQFAVLGWNNPTTGVSSPNYELRLEDEAGTRLDTLTVPRQDGDYQRNVQLPVPGAIYIVRLLSISSSGNRQEIDNVIFRAGEI